MRKLHVKTYEISREKDCVTVTLNGQRVANWEPVRGITCNDHEAVEDKAKIAQACAEEWVQPSNPMLGQVADFGETRLK